MGTAKRERQKANRAKKLETVQKTERRNRQRQYGILAVLGVAGLLGLLYLLSLGGDDDENTEATGTTVATDDTGQTTTTLGEAVPDEPTAVSAPAPGATSTGTPECPAEDGSSERTTAFAEAPPTCIDPAATYTAEVATTLGTFTIELDAAQAPETVNNFVFLARYGYYEDVPFHRIIPGFVIQGGDATGNPLGTGGPGYTIAEEPPTPAEGGLAYEVGSVAMANTGAPNSSGSQFFIVTGDQGTRLPPQYSLFGKVTEGLDVVQAIEALPTNPEDYPTEEIYIESVTITES